MLNGPGGTNGQSRLSMQRECCLGVSAADDPLQVLRLAPERMKALLDHLRELDAEIFAADDSLGWTYQFWCRSAEKKEVNDSQVAIGLLSCLR